MSSLLNATGAHERADPHSPSGLSRWPWLQRVRRLLIPVAVALYAVALPGLLLTEPGAAHAAFGVLAGAALITSLLGISCAERVRVSHW